MSRFLDALAGKPVDATPVWFMRQAGRYLPEYHERRKGPDGMTVDFFDAIRDAEMAADLTVQPVTRFGVDAAIVYSDILIIPQAMNCPVEMVPVKGGAAKKTLPGVEPPPAVGPDGKPAPQSRGPMRPNFPKPLVTPADLDSLDFAPDIEATLGFVCNTIRRTREKLSEAGKVDVAVIGFTGGPWTLMTYMVGEMSGGGGGVFAKAKKWLYSYPEASERLLQGIADVAAAFLIAQANAGAHMVQVFDSWAGALSPADFEKWELPALRRIAETFKAACPNKPIVIMPKGAHHSLEALAAIDAVDIIGLDWTISPSAVRGERSTEALRKQVVQGNIDPAFLMSGEADVTAAVTAMIEGFTTDGAGYIANVGNGLLTTTPVEGVAAMVDAVHRWRPAGQEVLRIGTRASALALVQARWCARRLKAQHPDLCVEIVEIVALGDKVQNKALHEIGAAVQPPPSADGTAPSPTAVTASGGALFTKELEEALLAGTVDMLVNCVKDMETRQPEGLELAVFCARGDSRDVVVMHPMHAAKGWKALSDLPPGSVVGTSSMRRTAILKRYHPTLEIEVVRGNVQTRLAKLDAKEPHPQKYDALILAQVGLERMGYSERISSVLEPDVFPYAVGQGSLGLEIRAADARVRGLVGFLDDGAARAECVAERSFLRSLAGGCRVPVGVECSSEGGVVSLKGRVWSTDGEAEFCAEESGGLGDAAKIGERVAAAVKAQAGASAAGQLRRHPPPTDLRCAGRCLGARRRGVGCGADPLGQSQLNVISAY